MNNYVINPLSSSWGGVTIFFVSNFCAVVPAEKLEVKGLMDKIFFLINIFLNKILYYLVQKVILFLKRYELFFSLMK